MKHAFKIGDDVKILSINCSVLDLRNDKEVGSIGCEGKVTNVQVMRDGSVYFLVVYKNKQLEMTYWWFKAIDLQLVKDKKGTGVHK